MGTKWCVSLILLPNFKALNLNSLKEFGCCSLTFRAHSLLWRSSSNQPRAGWEGNSHPATLQAKLIAEIMSKQICEV